MPDELKTERLQIIITPSERAAIDDYRFENRISSRSEAIRRLIEIGLKASQAAKPHA